jgi:hypothetical protein
MPRRLRDYGLADWLRLRPLSHGYKQAGRMALDAAYRRRKPADPAALAQAVATVAGRPLAVTVAFNAPWIIGWQLRFLGRFLDAAVLVADNSTDAAKAKEIAALCASRGVAYVRLPPNPYNNGRNFSMSHGFALNWIRRNVVAPARPPVFALLDHDLIPVAPVRLADYVARQPAFGRLETRGRGIWYLWPGFCVFDGAFAARHRLDFRPDGPNGLDTGGMNWWRVFRAMDRSALRFPEPGPGPYERFDRWVHFGNASEYIPVGADRRGHIVAFLERLWQEAGTAATGNP